MTSDKTQSSFPWKAALLGLGVGALAVVGWISGGADPGAEEPSQWSSAASGTKSMNQPLPAGHPPISETVSKGEKLSSRGLLEERRFLEAFDAAKQELERDPNDLDALYAHAMVRMRMGQKSQAATLFDEILERDPGFSEAAFVRGTLAVEAGDLSAAIAIWEEGLSAAGGEEASLSHVLTMARQGKFDQGLPKIPLG